MLLIHTFKKMSLRRMLYDFTMHVLLVPGLTDWQKSLKSSLNHTGGFPRNTATVRFLIDDWHEMETSNPCIGLLVCLESPSSTYAGQGNAFKSLKFPRHDDTASVNSIRLACDS